MEHVVVFLYILSMTLGFSVVLIAFVLWLKNKNTVLKQFLLFAASLTLILIEQMISAYAIANEAESGIMATVMRFVSAAGCSLLIYSYTRLVRMLLGREISAASLRGLAGYALVPCVAAVFYSFTGATIVLWVSSALLFLNILYNTVTLLLHSQHIHSDIIRTGTRNLAIVALILLPIMAADIFIERITFFGGTFTFGLFSVIVFYTVFSAMSLYYMVKGFHTLISRYGQTDTPAYDQHKLDVCHITSREKEIINGLLRGLTYRQIGETLSISMPTVKTHVTNIYKKIGVQNKIELLNALKTQNNLQL